MQLATDKTFVGKGTVGLVNKICQQFITPFYECMAVFRQAAFPPTNCQAIQLAL